MKIKNKKEAIEYCINKGFNEEDARFIVDNAWDYHSIHELEDAINYLEEEKKWKKRSIWKKIIFDNDRKLRTIIGFLFFFAAGSLLIGIIKTLFLLRTYYIGKECPLGTEPSWLKRSCVEVVCNGDAISTGAGYGCATINERRLFFLDTFIYDPSVSKCVSKCADLDEEYYQNFVIPTNPKILWKDDYYYWKDGQCHLLPYYKNTMSKDRALENKKLADKIKQEEDAIKQHFMRLLEENKEYYKKAR